MLSLDLQIIKITKEGTVSQNEDDNVPVTRACLANVNFKLILMTCAHKKSTLCGPTYLEISLLYMYVLNRS